MYTSFVIADRMRNRLLCSSEINITQNVISSNTKINDIKWQIKHTVDCHLMWL